MPEPAAATATALPEERTISRRGLIAAAMLLSVIGAALVMGIGSSASPSAQAVASRSSRTPDAVPKDAGSDDAAFANAYRTADSKRSGAAAYLQGDFAGALSDFQAAVDASPDDSEARNNLAQVLIRQGRAKDALPHLDEAVRITPDRWSYRFNRARTYGLLNRWEEAVADYRQASRLFPDDHPTLYNLGLALLRTKQYAESVAALERAVAMAPDEHGFLITLGTAYVGAEQPDRARAVFEQFLKDAPSDPDVPRVKGLLEAMTAAGQ